MAGLSVEEDDFLIRIDVNRENDAAFFKIAKGLAQEGIDPTDIVAFQIHIPVELPMLFRADTGRRTQHIDFGRGGDEPECPGKFDCVTNHIFFAGTA